MRVLLAIILSTFGSQIAYAQEAASQPSLLMQFFPIIAMIFIFYFLMIRPQMRNQKVKQEFLSQMKRGDEVLTTGGIFGTIEGLTEKFVTLQVADGVKIRVLRSNILGSSKEVKND